MRSLQTRDLFNAVRLVKEIGIREEIKNVALKVNVNDENKEKINIEEIGIDLIFSIFDRAVEKNVEEKIYEFLAGPFECEVNDIAKMDPLELLERITKVADIKKWKDFLSKAAQLMK